MIFPSLRALPSVDLGKLLIQWEYRPPYTKGLLYGGGIALLIVLGIYLYFYSPEDFDFLKDYRSILIYFAVPLISYFFSRVINATRKRDYLLFEKGFLIYYGKPENKKAAGNWAAWHDFTRAELRDDGVKIFPKNAFQQTMFFYCQTNRLNVYGIISNQIAQHKYIPFDDEK
jgi:hypothetical protein